MHPLGDTCVLNVWVTFDTDGFVTSSTLRIPLLRQQQTHQYIGLNSSTAEKASDTLNIYSII